MKKMITAMLLSVFFISGCTWNQSPEELQRLTKEDPAFKLMITQRDQARRQVSLIKNDLLKRKQVMDAETEKFRAQFDVYSKAANLKMDQYRTAIDADRSKLKGDIDISEARIETKQAELEGYQKTLVDVQKVLTESKGITLSPQEKKKWEERVLMLNEKIRPLTDEIQDLKLQIRLKKQKIGYLN